MTREAQDAWVTCCSPARPSMIGAPDCTPGYYNNEGQDAGAFLGHGYPYGPNAYFAYIEGWRAAGDFAGLEFR